MTLILEDTNRVPVAWVLNSSANIVDYPTV
jgi:hypothetical protein